MYKTSVENQKPQKKTERKMSLDLRSGNDLQGTRMTHSLSTPSGVDGVMTSHGGKKLAVRIQMLDDSITMFQVQVSYLVRKT